MDTGAGRATVQGVANSLARLCTRGTLFHNVEQIIDFKFNNEEQMLYSCANP